MNVSNSCWASRGPTDIAPICLAVDFSNVLNTNVTWDARNLSGTINALEGGVPGSTVNVLPQFLSPAAVLGPRNIRLSAAFRF